MIFLFFNSLIQQTTMITVRCQVLTVMSMELAVFWDVAPCSLAEELTTSIFMADDQYMAQTPRRQPSSRMSSFGNFVPYFTLIFPSGACFSVSNVRRL
jgi:hypothetical protein